MYRLKLLFSLVLVLSMATAAQALTIDYAYVSTHDYDSLGQGVYNAIGEQTWMFTHASVGSNMMSGMDTLHSQNANKYQLTTPSASRTSPPATTTPGSVYDVNRGNPGWSAKFAQFAEAVDTYGWGDKVDFAMDKLCYIDGSASAQDYIDMMTALESQTTATLVWTTMPLYTGTGNNARNAYNEAVRAYAEANNKLLFDIADLEAHDAAGNEYTYTSGGLTYQMLYSGWTSDGGHLNSAGSVWIAEAWYSLAASQTPIPGAIWLLGTGLLGLLGIRKRIRN